MYFVIDDGSGSGQRTTRISTKDFSDDQIYELKMRSTNGQVSSVLSRLSHLYMCDSWSVSYCEACYACLYCLIRSI